MAEHTPAIYEEYLSLEDAVKLLLDTAKPVQETETLPLLAALGRISAQAQLAIQDQPPFDRSPLDGYAVRHKDIAGASRHTPAALSVTQSVFAGDWPEKSVEPGQAARIMTGAAIPTGADCVVRQEDTDCGENMVRIFREHGDHENICDRGEDISSGAPLIAEGERLSAAHLGLLAAQGIAVQRVFRRARVGVLTTGDELVEPGAGELPSGKIYSSNGVLLAARAAELGHIPVLGGNGPDEAEALCALLLGLLERCDLVVATGGVSVGQRDCLPQAAALMGARVLFKGVAIKPGAPMLALEKAGKLLLCLSGNPFAAAATFELLARPALAKLAGRNEHHLPRAKAVLRDPFSKSSPGRRFLRAHISGGEASLTRGAQLSGALGALAGCNCFIDIPAASPPLKAGSKVEVVLL